MLDYNAVVVGRVGIVSKAVLAALRRYDDAKTATVPLLGLTPKLIFRVEDECRVTLTTDPVEVNHLTRGHDAATVEIIPVIA